MCAATVQLQYDAILEHISDRNALLSDKVMGPWALTTKLRTRRASRPASHIFAELASVPADRLIVIIYTSRMDNDHR